MKPPTPTPTSTFTPTPTLVNLIQDQRDFCEVIMENSIQEWVFNKITRIDATRVYTYNELMSIRDELNAIFTIIHIKMGALLFELEESRDHQ